MATRLGANVWFPPTHVRIAPDLMLAPRPLDRIAWRGLALFLRENRGIAATNTIANCIRENRSRTFLDTT
jgi:hypothetical protein